VIKKMDLFMVNPDKIQKTIDKMYNILLKAIPETIAELDKEIEIYNSEINKIEKELKEL